MNAYPHRCPKCSSPAYIGFRAVDCSNPHCPLAGDGAKMQRKLTPTRSFVCWSGEPGGPPCTGVVVVINGTGVCPDCGSHYATATTAQARP